MAPAKKRRQEVASVEPAREVYVFEWTLKVEITEFDCETFDDCNGYEQQSFALELRKDNDHDEQGVSGDAYGSRDSVLEAAKTKFDELCEEHFGEGLDEEDSPSDDEDVSKAQIQAEVMSADELFLKHAVFEPRSKQKTKNYVIGFERSGAWEKSSRAWEKSDWNYGLTHVMHSDIKVNIRKVRVLP
jgi:hypothetical protein